VESGDKYKAVPIVELHHDRSASNAVKIKIPAREYPKVGPKICFLIMVSSDRTYNIPRDH